MDPDKRKLSSTTDGQPPREGFENSPAPAPINPATGQHEAYWVLSEEERAKGFVRPVRRTYKHVGLTPKYPLVDLTDEQKQRYGSVYVKYEPYPEDESPMVGCFWTQERFDRIDKGCQCVTSIGQAIAETYSRDPRYYGSTFCCNCQKHFPVEEFVWVDDGTRVGS